MRTSSGHDLPTITPGAAKAQVASFEHNHIGDASLRQLQRGVDTRETATDDIGINVAF
jgi:hypothetical protein